MNLSSPEIRPEIVVNVPPQAAPPVKRGKRVIKLKYDTQGNPTEAIAEDQP